MLSIFIGVVSLAIDAWKAFNEYASDVYNQQAQERAAEDRLNILAAIAEVNANLRAIADEIIQAILSTEVYQKLTDLIGTLQGLKNRYESYPVSGTTMDPSEDLANIIYDCMDLEGQITSEFNMCLTSNVPFRYPCCLFTLYSNTMCFLFTAMDEHSATFGSDFRDKKNFEELHSYSKIFINIITNLLTKSFGPVTSSESRKKVDPEPGSQDYSYTIYARYAKGVLDVDYNVVSNRYPGASEFLGEVPHFMVEEKRKVLEDTVIKEQQHDLDNTISFDPLVQLGIKNSEIITKVSKFYTRSIFKKLEYPKVAISHI